MKKPYVLIAAVLLLSAILLKPPQIQVNGSLYGGVGSDDFCYLATATAIAYGQWPNFSKEQICHSEMPMASVGPGLMAAPFVFIFSFIDRITKNSVVEMRTEKNIVNSATSWGFIFATLFYFGLTLVFIRKIFSKLDLLPFDGDIAIIFMILFQGTLLYVVRRPVFSHAYELFSLSALLLFLMSGREKLMGIKQVLLGGLLCFLVGTTRYNDLPLALIWPAIFFFVDSGGLFYFDKVRVTSYTKIQTIFLSLFVIFKVLPTYLHGQEKYAGMAKNLLLGSRGLEFWIVHMKYVLFGTDFGLIFTAPFLLIGIGSLVFTKFPQKKRFIFLGLTLLINFYLAVSFGTNGGWYGYRYFVFSAFPVAIVPFGFLLSNLKRQNSKLFWSGVVALSVVPLFSMLFFEGNDSLIQTQILIFGQSEYGNPDYQLKVWRIITHEPLEALRILTKGVPIYLVYCLAKITGLAGHLPAVIQEKFSQTGFSLFLRTLLVLAVPVMPLCLTHRFNSSAKLNGR